MSVSEYLSTNGKLIVGLRAVFHTVQWMVTRKKLGAFTVF